MLSLKLAFWLQPTRSGCARRNRSPAPPTKHEVLSADRGLKFDDSQSSAREAEAHSALLPDFEQLDVEDECRVRRNHAAGAARAVRKVRWQHQPTLSTNFHPLHPLIPAADHLAGAEAEAEWTAVD